MTETEIKNPTGSENNESKTTPEINQAMLDDKIQELGLLEKQIFGGDGKIGQGSNDSIIDQKYDKGGESLQSIAQKIELVKNLIIEFHPDSAINQSFETQRTGKYITEESKKYLMEGQKKIDEILKQFPHMKEVILSFLQHNFHNTNFHISFFEKEYQETGNQENINLIGNLLQDNYKVFSEYFTGRLLSYLKEIDKNPHISDKSKFLSYYFKCGYQGSEGKEGINYVFQIINSSPLTKEIIGSSKLDDEKLADIISIGFEDIQKLQNLYLKGNNKNIIEFIDNKISPELREKFLIIPNINNLYISEKRGLINNINTSKDVLFTKTIQDLPNHVVLSLSKIQNKEASKQILDFLIGMNTISDYGKIVDFINKPEGMKSLLGKTKSTIEKIHILEVFSNYIEKKIFTDPKTSLIAKEHFAGTVDFLKKNINEEINEGLNNLKVKYKDNPKKLLEISNFEKNPEKSIGFLETYGASNVNLHSSQTRPPETKPTSETVNKPQIKEANATLNKIGAGSKFQVDENGKMVSSKYLEKKEQAIANGETPPPEENIRESIQLGRKGQIEFGTNGKMVFTSSLGYTFELENNLTSIKKALDITETFDYMDKIGLGYFENNLKGMIESIGTYLPNQASFLSINEANGNFLSIYELQNIIIPIFQNIGFIEKSQNIDQLAPEQMTDTVMNHRVSEVPGGEAFLKGKSFNKALFGQLLQNTNKV